MKSTTSKISTSTVGKCFGKVQVQAGAFVTESASVVSLTVRITPDLTGFNITSVVLVIVGSIVKLVSVIRPTQSAVRTPPALLHGQEPPQASSVASLRMTATGQQVVAVRHG